ncbi:hypothetical protein TKK_0011105 [Trichogramma kaykai]
MARVALHPLLCLALACHSRPCHVMACSPQLPQSLAIRNSQYFPQPQLPLKDDNLKFCSVITHAGANICKSISAFLKSVPDAEPEKYSKLKEHLISKYSQTVHQKINQLLAGVSLEGKNPSDLFNDMSSLAQGHVPVETVLLLWYRHLPTELVMVLGEAVTSSNAPQASAKVDRLFEHIKHKFTPQICAVAPPNSSQGVDDALVNRISELVISAVSSKFESNSMRDRSVEKQEKPQSPRSSSKPRHGENKDLCLYHHRYKEKARDCSTPPCSWPNSKLLFVADIKSGNLFLIDTGAEVSVLQKCESDDSPPSSLVLHAANGTAIATYGSRVLSLDFGLRRDLAWTFICADVPYPILGADALAHFDLLPDLKRFRLIDNVTKLSAKGQLAPANLTGVSVLDPLHPLAHLLSRYPQAIRPTTPNSDHVTAISHSLQTSGEPIAQKARRLTPEKLKALRFQFKVWCNEGSCRSSNSPWASPIHIVPKKTPGEFRICGDYRKLNVVTTPNKYPVPCIKDFTNILSGKSIFSTLDLHQAFNQIPMAPEDVPKTALITSIGADNSVADALSRLDVSEVLIPPVNGNVDALALPLAASLKQLSKEQAKDEQLKAILSDPDFPMSLQKGIYPIENHLLPIYSNVSHDAIRPYIPLSLRRDVFHLFHRLAHSGPSATDKLLRRKYVWPRMTKDIALWVKNCLSCQQAKIARHTKLAPARFSLPDDRFSRVHLDIVTLVESEGYTHALTMIDRYARWSEAVPIVDMQAAIVARAFVETWVARYGAPETITTDQGMQFDGELFARLCKLLGSNKIRTTPYHPQSNGLLERWNRDFKRALMCFESDEGWTKILPLVMLGLRTRVRSDINSSPAEMVFGSTLRLPGEFFSDHDQEPDLHYFTSEFRSFMKAVRPVPVDPHDKSKPFVHKNLEFCSRVFVRANPIKKALDPPYLGPYQVHLRPSKYFYIIKITNKTVLEELKTVSTGQLKPAFGTFYDAQNPIKSSPDSNQNQTVKFDTRDSDLCDNFDHEEVVPTIKPSSDKALRTGDNVASKQLCKRSFSQSESKSMKPKKKVKFHDDHAYSVANKSSSKKK